MSPMTQLHPLTEALLTRRGVTSSDDIERFIRPDYERDTNDPFLVLNMARAGEPLKAVASFHGILATDVSVKPGDIHSKIRVFTGDADPAVPPEQVSAFQTEMDNAKADYKLVSYPGVKHTFTNREADSYATQYGLPLKYDPAADTDSWTQTLAFLKATLK